MPSTTVDSKCLDRIQLGVISQTRWQDTAARFPQLPGTAAIWLPLSTCVRCPVGPSRASQTFGQSRSLPRLGMTFHQGAGICIDIADSNEAVTVTIFPVWVTRSCRIARENCRRWKWNGRNRITVRVANEQRIRCKQEQETLAVWRMQDVRVEDALGTFPEFFAMKRREALDRERAGSSRGCRNAEQNHLDLPPARDFRGQHKTRSNFPRRVTDHMTPADAIRTQYQSPDFAVPPRPSAQPGDFLGLHRGRDFGIPREISVRCGQSCGDLAGQFPGGIFQRR